MKTHPLPSISRLSATAAAAGLAITFAPLIYAAPEADPAKKNDPAEVESKQYQAKQEEAEKAPAANGKVFSVEPELLSVVVEGSATPLKFKYDHNTPYVDENGKEVSMELIRPDLPLTVHYHGTGEILTASKVVVTRRMVDGASPKTEAKREQIAKENAKEVEKEKIAQATEPETVMGTVSTVEQTITINARGESTPRSFVINNSTRYLNASGQPVSTDLIFSGMPITVKAVSDGNRLIAQIITVRGGSDSAASQYPSNGGTQGGGAANGTTGETSSSTSAGYSGSAGTGINGSVRTSRGSSGGGADLPFNGVYNPGIIGPIPNANRGNQTVDPAIDTSGTIANGSSGSAQAQTPASTSTNTNTVQPGPGGANRNTANSNNNNNAAGARPGANQGQGNASNQPNPDNRPSANQPANNQPANNQPANNQPSGTNTTAPANGSSDASGNNNNNANNNNRSGNNQNQGASNRSAGSSNNAGSSSGSNSGSRSGTSSGSGRASGNGSSGAPAPSASGGGSGGAPAPSR